MNSQNIDDIILQLSCLNINIAPSVRYIINREFLKKNDLYFSEIVYEDVEWSARVLALIESIYIYTKKFYKYRLRSNSLSSSQNFMMYYTYTKIIINLYEFSFKLDNYKRIQESMQLTKFFQNNSKLIEHLYDSHSK